MHAQYPAHETIRERIERDLAGIRGLVDETPTDSLSLERLPSGELAWLRPESTVGLDYQVQATIGRVVEGLLDAAIHEHEATHHALTGKSDKLSDLRPDTTAAAIQTHAPRSLPTPASGAVEDYLNRRYVL